MRATSTPETFRVSSMMRPMAPRVMAASFRAKNCRAPESPRPLTPKRPGMGVQGALSVLPGLRTEGGVAAFGSRVHVGHVQAAPSPGPVRLPVGIVLAFANHLDGENTAALGAQVAGQSLGHERHHAIGIGVGKKSQSSEVDGQDGNLAVMEQVHGMQHGAVAAEHDDQRQLPGQLRTHVTAPLVGAK